MSLRMDSGDRMIAFVYSQPLDSALEPHCSSVRIQPTLYLVCWFRVGMGKWGCHSGHLEIQASYSSMTSKGKTQVSNNSPIPTQVLSSVFPSAPRASTQGSHLVLFRSALTSEAKGFLLKSRSEAGDIAQLVESLSSIQEVLVQFLERHVWWYIPENPSMWEVGEGKSKF